MRYPPPRTFHSPAQKFKWALVTVGFVLSRTASAETVVIVGRRLPFVGWDVLTAMLIQQELMMNGISQMEQAFVDAVDPDMLLADLEKELDLRCDARFSGATSRSPTEERSLAAQQKYDSLGQRVQEGVFTSAGRALSGRFRQVTITYSDGGTELFSFIGAMGSQTLAPIPGSLRAGTGESTCPA